MKKTLLFATAAAVVTAGVGAAEKTYEAGETCTYSFARRRITASQAP